MPAPVLIIGTFLSHAGGSRTVCEELALRLRANGRRVLTTSTVKARIPRLADMLGTVLRCRREYAVAQVDVYSGPAFLWAEAVTATLKWLGKPVVLTLHGGNLPTFAKKHPGRVARLLRKADLVTAPSMFLCHEVAPLGVEALHLPNGLDLQSYAFKARTAASPDLVWLRAFHQIYNPALAPKVLALVLPNFPHARLMMIGPDKGDGSRDETLRRADELGVGFRMHLPGQIAKAEVPAWLARGDIFLNTTNVDNAPVSVVEAMATGQCIVSTNVGGLRYMISDGEDGLLVPPKAPELMASAVKRVLEEPTLAERLSRGARARAQAYDWQNVLPRWMEILNQLSGMGRVGDLRTRSAALGVPAKQHTAGL